MEVHLNCGKCYKDTIADMKDLAKTVNLQCKCGHYLIKDGNMKLRRG